MIITFNAEPPIESPVTLPDDWSVPNVGWRNAPIEHVYDQTSDFVRAIIDQTPLMGEHKSVLLTLKLQSLNAGAFSDARTWHCDGWGRKRSPDTPTRAEYNHLFILGGAPVEFVSRPVQMRWLRGYSIDRLWKQIQSKDYMNLPARAVRLGVFNTYDCFDLKRGVKAKEPLTRLLIRVTETDAIRANPDPVKPDRKED